MEKKAQQKAQHSGFMQVKKARHEVEKELSTPVTPLANNKPKHIVKYVVPVNLFAVLSVDTDE